MFTNSKLAKSVKLACAFGAASSIGFTGAVNAQETEQAAEAVEKIEVTGSRIRRTDIEGANPVTVMSRIDIERFGVTSIGDVLQAIPSAGSAINTNNNNGGNGTTTINIRGIGSNRTLVLVNGKRWAPGLTGSVDLNNIPAAIIERIEVLKDGASAVYGSDGYHDRAHMPCNGKTPVAVPNWEIQSRPAVWAAIRPRVLRPSHPWRGRHHHIQRRSSALLQGSHCRGRPAYRQD